MNFDYFRPCTMMFAISCGEITSMSMIWPSSWLMMSLLIFQAPHNVVRYELRGDNLNVIDLAFFMVDDVTFDFQAPHNVVRYELRGDNLNVDDLAFFMVDDVTFNISGSTQCCSL